MKKNISIKSHMDYGSYIFYDERNKIKMNFKVYKIVNELNESALRYLYKDIKYNWSNNINHEIDLTDVILRHEDEEIVHHIHASKTPESGLIFLSYINDNTEVSRLKINNSEDFQIGYFNYLNKAKSSSGE